jgi:TolB-like protein
MKILIIKLYCHVCNPQNNIRRIEMKSIVIMILVLLITACGAQQKQAIKKKPVTLDSQLEDLTDQIVLSLSEQKKSKIAVIEFSDLEGNVTQFGRYLAEELITRLFRTGRFEVIERQMLNKVMEEHSLTLSGMIDENSAKELGRILGVDAIASGSVTDLGNDVKVNARLISTETGKVFSVASVKIIKDDVLQRLMGNQIKETPVVQTESSNSSPTSSKPAGMVVSDGGFDVELLGCTLANRRVTCNLTITNTTEDDMIFEIIAGWRYRTMIFDDLGNEYPISEIKIGNVGKKMTGYSQYEGVNKKIVAGTTVPLELTFDKVSSQATKITLLQILRGSKGGKIEFRDVDLILM